MLFRFAIPSFFVALILFTVMPSVKGQIIQQSIISPFGSLAEYSNYELQFNAGEPIISHLAIDSNYYGQGFVQPTGEFPFYIEESDAASNQWLLYPNPTGSLFQIQSSNLNASFFSIEIKNGLGEVLYFAKNTTDTQINIENWAGGIYFVQLFSSKSHESYFIKLVKR
jgi:hypothetical protein